MKITELLCFGAQAGQGNAALVVQGDGWDTDQRQRFAHAQQRSACVFIDASGDSAGNAHAQAAPWVLDYFYPHTRSPLCLHATLAAAAVLLDGAASGIPDNSDNRATAATAAGADTRAGAGDAGAAAAIASPAGRDLPARSITVRTAMHGQLLRLSRAEDGLFIALARQPAPSVALAPELPARLLSQPGLQLASAPAIASVGSPKLLLEMRDCAALQTLSPDLALITAWGKEHGVNGVYAWARRADGALEGRNFNHLDPRLEDRATGVAAGALTLHLGHGIVLHQGAHLGQPCLLRTALQDQTVRIGGAAQAIPYHAI